MKTWLVPATGAMLLLAAAGCGPSGETPKGAPPPSPTTKEGMFTLGRQFWFEHNTDSAVALLSRAATLDSLYNEPVRELAQVHYELGLRAAEQSRDRLNQFRASRAQFARLASRGVKEADVYDRLCELSIALSDTRSFVSWAKVSADAYPYDRQHYNLCRAYFDAGDYQSVIRAAKSDIETFKVSPYVSSFYRILGRAYMKVDRDQTAERILSAGLKATESKLAQLRKSGGDAGMTDAYRRLRDDKINMLLLLKQLHTTYKADDKLRQVDRQLKEEGYDR